MGAAYPELHSERERIEVWLSAEEEHFGHTLEQGMVVLSELIERAREGSGVVAGEDAFRLHDTFGFPIELTGELVAEAGLEVEQQGFDERMADQRRRSRAEEAGGAMAPAGREEASAFAGAAGFTTRFTGYETTEQATTVGAVERSNGRVLVKLADSPFYPAGGGQVSDVGVIECADGDCRARVAEAVRLGDDQALYAVLEQGELRPGERVLARVDPAARRAAECNHTATHLLHAALRSRLGQHVHQAGSYVGPDKLRFDFSHGQALSPQELRDVEDQVNAWVLENHPVRPITTTLDEARALGAMALFGEKYGEIVRMVEIGDGEFSRELCGGTHVHATAEIGLMRILGETSSAANVRRIEAITGPVAVATLRERDRALEQIARTVRSTPEEAAAVVAAREGERRELEKAARKNAQDGAVDVAALAATARAVGDVQLRRRRRRPRRPQGVARHRRSRPRQAVRRRRGGARELRRQRRRQRRQGPFRAHRRRRDPHRAVGRVRWRGRRPRDLRAGRRRRPGEGRRCDRGRASGARAHRRMRILALDYGSARTGVAVCDPTETVVTPLQPVLAAATRAGIGALAALVAEREAELVLVGLPLTLAGGESAQTAEARAFAQKLERRLGPSVPVALHDERLTTRLAARDPSQRASEDSRAAAHLLEDWLARRRSPDQDSQPR